MPNNFYKMLQDVITALLCIDLPNIFLMMSLEYKRVSVQDIAFCPLIQC